MVLTRLVLEGVEVLATLSDLGDIIPHDTDCIVNLTLDRGRLGVAACLGSSARRGASAGQVRVIWFRPVPSSHPVEFEFVSFGRCRTKGGTKRNGTSALGKVTTTPVAPWEGR